MDFETFQAMRLHSLCNTKRCASDGDVVTEHDYPRGLLELINFGRPKSIIEIGSYRGVSTEMFLLTCQRVVAVDPWEYPEGIYNEFIARCGKYPGLEVYRGRSPDELARFGNEFDMCYIDGLHEEAAIIADITACHRIVKPWGAIAGHDFHLPHVKRAVMSCLLSAPAEFKDGSWLVSNNSIKV